jgi:hypothetical protein
LGEGESEPGDRRRAGGLVDIAEKGLPRCLRSNLILQKDFPVFDMVFDCFGANRVS